MTTKPDLDAIEARLESESYIAREQIAGLTKALREAWEESKQLRLELARWQPRLVPQDTSTGQQAPVLLPWRIGDLDA